MDPITISDDVIRVTKLYLKSLGPLSDEDQETLQAELVGQTMCPASFSFNDNSAIRRILHLEDTDAATA